MAALVQVLWIASVCLSASLAMDCSGKQTASDIVRGLDLSGKTYVLTGGDAGLGFETALALASAKASVILACRSRTKCPAAVRNITQATGNKKVSVIPFDLSSFESVRQCAAAIRQQVPHIDVLINNAGILNNPSSLPAKTNDGFDRVYQVNFLSNHLLIQELLPLLRHSNARVINVASIASKWACLWGNYLPGCENIKRLPEIAKTRPRGLSFVGTHASNYGMSKYLEVFLTAELARREQNITAFSLHPGVVETDMTGHLPWAVMHLWCGSDLQTPCPRTGPEGATTQTYVTVASQTELASSNGKYFDSCKVARSVRDSYASKHGEKATLVYQSAIFDMADHLTGGNASASNDDNKVLV